MNKNSLYITVGLIFATIPFDSIEFYGRSISDLLMIFSMFQMMLFVIQGKIKISISINMLLLSVIYLFSVFAAGLNFQAINSITYIFGGIYIIFITCIAINEHKKLIFILNLYLFSAIFQAVFSIYQYISYYYFDNNIGFIQNINGISFFRAIGTQIDPNYFSIFLLLALYILIFRIIETKKNRYLNLLSLFLIVIGLILSVSRNSWFAIVSSIAFLFIYLFWKKNLSNRQTLFIYTHSFLFLIVIFYIFLPLLNISLIRSIIDFNPTSVYSRYTTYDVAIGLIIEKPFFGYGYANITDSFVHNTYLYILLRRGLFGFIPFVSFVFHSLNNMLNNIIFNIKNKNVFGYSPIIIMMGLISVFVSFLSVGIEGHKMIWMIIAISSIKFSNMNIVNYIGGSAK